MNYKETKKLVWHEAFTTGVSVADISSDFMLDVPAPIQSRWKKQWQSVSPISLLPSKPRLVNRFSIGADPELYFTDLNENVVNADQLGLATAVAFGMDQNGRLAELRPAPSRFAFDIVASILAELRWGAIFYRETRNLNWFATPYNGRDGLGGHFHVAKKRSETVYARNDVRALDMLFEAMRKKGIFDNAWCQLRSRATDYGRYGDYRLQRHGYEYRAFPTWIETPWMAYLSLVLAKLAITNPKLTLECQFQITKSRNNNNFSHLQCQFVENLLHYYKGQDDDAAIALNALQVHGWPKQKGNSIQEEWGILYAHNIHGPKVQYLPGMILPSTFDKEDLWNYLMKKEKIPPRAPVPTWIPNRLPADYRWLPEITPMSRRMGMGEIVYDLCYNNKESGMLINSIDGDVFVLTVPQWFNEQDSITYKEIGKWIKRLSERFNLRLSVKFTGTNDFHFTFPQILRQSNEGIRELRKFLVSGIFPIWKVTDVKLDSFKVWSEMAHKNGAASSHKAIKLEGRELN